jgi:hypothetical protein
MDRISSVEDHEPPYGMSVEKANEELWYLLAEIWHVDLAVDFGDHSHA